ncbi:MAG: MFS transporter, partial [Proteobacteria bacterium]|nr:MFS transporter [Pseudomonadota bacterium]
MDSIRKQTAYLKTLFFLLFIGLGISLPFFGIFYKHVIVHADGAPAIGMIGLIFFVMPLVSLIANIPAGILADKFHSGKHLITLFCFGVALFAALIGLAGEDFARDWTANGKFIYIFVLLLFLNGFFYPIMPMLDAETLLFLNKHFRREFYGAYRVWGTYGWSVSTILMGGLLFYFHHAPLIFYGVALAFTILGFVAWSGIEAKPTAVPIIIPWSHLKKDILFRWFLLFVFLHGVVTASSFT